MCNEGFDTTVKEYRKKPVVITAYRTNEEMQIKTLEGVMKASVGDYIVTGVQGETYPVKPDIFNETYEEVTEGKTIEDWYNEWADLLETISDKSIELHTLKENLIQAEQDIIENTNFKALYGKNNESVRKAHLRDELQAEYDAKFELEHSIGSAKRKIEYIKSITNMQRALVDVGVIE